MTSYLTTFFHSLSSIFTSTPISPPNPSSSPLPPCSFPLSTTYTRNTTLPSGRTLSYEEYGAPTGTPIFFVHGFPGSRFDAAFFHTLGVELHARIIGTDRPGIGGSTTQPGRSLCDFARDVEYLAEHLRLEKYGVMGASGGGPYVLACARYLPPENLACVAIICGLGPPHISMWGADLAHLIAFPYGVRWAPYWMGRALWRSDATGRIELSDEERLEMCLKGAAGASGSDKDIICNVDFLRVSLRSSREAFKQGYDGVWEDGKVCCKKFGFELREIREDLPIKMWYGSGDKFVPLGHGQGICKELIERGGGMGRVDFWFKQEVHVGIFYRWRRDILEGILKEM